MNMTLSDIIGCNALAAEYARLYYCVSHGAAMRHAHMVEDTLSGEHYDAYLNCVDACMADEAKRHTATARRVRKAARKLYAQQPYSFTGAYRGDMAHAQNTAFRHYRNARAVDGGDTAAMFARDEYPRLVRDYLAIAANNRVDASIVGHKLP